ncbi:MAG TPA: hypothetical protein VER14_05430 [Phototrophicaceae bacterium]|nr:hypothetical protein [Phototrophicaceae bacterium]
MVSLSMNMAILWNGHAFCLLVAITSFFGIAEVNAYDVALADHHMMSGDFYDGMLLI